MRIVLKKLPTHPSNGLMPPNISISIWCAASSLALRSHLGKKNSQPPLPPVLCRVFHYRMVFRTPKSILLPLRGNLDARLFIHPILLPSLPAPINFAFPSYLRPCLLAEWAGCCVSTTVHRSAISRSFSLLPLPQPSVVTPPPASQHHLDRLRGDRLDPPPPCGGGGEERRRSEESFYAEIETLARCRGLPAFHSCEMNERGKWAVRIRKSKGRR